MLFTTTFTVRVCQYDVIYYNMYSQSLSIGCYLLQHVQSEFVNMMLFTTTCTVRVCQYDVIYYNMYSQSLSI